MRAGLLDTPVTFLRRVDAASPYGKGSVTWEEALTMAERVPMQEVLLRAMNIDKHDVCNMQYTSGTTGFPKGVMLTHGNIVSNVKATLECVFPQVGDIFLSFLPLSHTFERTAGYYLALATGCTIAYNRSVLLLADDLKTIRPTVIISVPRVYERIFARVHDKLKKSRPCLLYTSDAADEL